MSFDFINSHLQARQQSALNRKRYVIEQASAREIIVDNKRYLNFASNDYLGFADEPTLLEGMHSLARKNRDFWLSRYQAHVTRV